MKDDIFKFGLKNEAAPKTSWHNIKKIITRRTSISIFNLLLVGLAILIIGMIISKCPSCPEITNETEECICPELNCSECEPQKQLRVVSTYVCPDGTIAGDSNDCILKEKAMQKYVCEDGSVVDNAEECKETLEITTKYQETDNDLILAVDEIDYDMKDDDWGTITQISYAVRNLGEQSILPEIHVRVFNESDLLSTEAYTRHTIKVNKTLEKGEFATGVENVHISFKGINITTKFVLVNGLDEVQQAKVVLERPLDE